MHNQRTRVICLFIKLRYFIINKCLIYHGIKSLNIKERYLSELPTRLLYDEKKST